jgi:methylthioxylose transferase
MGFVVATFAVGLTLDAAGVVLGTPLPPLLFGLHHEMQLGWTLLTVVILVATVALAPRLRSLGPWAFGVAILALALVVRLAVGTVRYGPDGWDEPWNESFNAKNEYVPALPSIDHLGVGYFLDRFDEILPALPVHVAGHPPGFVLTLHWLGLDTPGSAAALAIFLGALAVPLTYLLGRRLLDEGRARIAGLLAAMASAMTLYGVTSADIVFAALGAGAAVLLLASPRVAATAGAAALAVASFFSYALLALGAWSALVRLLREGWRVALGVAAACGAGLVVFYAGIWALTGFALHDVVIATEEVYRESVARLRPYAFWLFGSPAAFLAFLGLPITWYAARALGHRHPAAVALAIVILISAAGGFTKAETERIWLMYAPLACVAAAAVLPERHLRLVLALLVAQSLAVELLFGTVW